MRYCNTLVLGLLALFSSYAQEHTVTCKIVDGQSSDPLSGVSVAIEGSAILEMTDASGFFKLTTSLSGEHILSLMLTDYRKKRFPMVLEGQVLDLGTITLERDITSEQTDNLITLTDSELLDDEVSSNSAGLLQATRDVFLNRAAFDLDRKASCRERV